MKLFTLTLRVILCLVLWCFVSRPTVLAQTNGYQCCIKNLQQTSPTEIQFDVMLEWSGTNSAKLTFLQGGINFNYNALSNGGVITGAFKPGSADPSLPPVQQTPNWNINTVSKQIRLLAAIATPSTIATPVSVAPGFRVGTFVMTNTVPFSSNSPAFAWSFVTGSSTTTQTKMGFYINGATTSVDITNQSSHCVGSSSTPNCPTANAGGTYTSCGDVHLNGTITNATTGTWTSSGTGTFDPNNTTLNATYHPSAADLANGNVFFTLTTDAGASGCTAAVSTSGVTFTSIDDGLACTTDGCDQSTGMPTHSATTCCPEITVVGNRTTCGDVHMNATVQFATGGTWTSTGTGYFSPSNAAINAVYHSSAGDFAAGSVILTVTSTGGDPNCSPDVATVNVTYVSIDDGDPCTIDACNQTSGQATHEAGNCPGQINYNACVRNITQTSPTTMQFDVWMEWTGSYSAKLAFLQGGLDFNYAGISNGGTITGMYLAGSADPVLPATQQAPNWNLNAASKQIRLIAAIATPASIAATIPPPTGFRLGTFILTNTVPFTPSSTPNFVWSFSGGTSTTTQTKIGAYLNGATTAREITIATGHCVQSNNLLNACLNANVDDGNPCTDDACNTETGSITHVFNGPFVSVTAGTIACYGSTTCVTVSATGGTTPLNGIGVICDYPAGQHSFTVVDNNGCAASASTVISEPSKIVLSTSSTPSGGSDGTATVSVIGGAPGYNYNWSNGQTGSTATGLSPGIYCVIVTDANGCTSAACETVGSSCNLDAPGAISGLTGVCKKQNGVVYCVTPNPLATSYTWLLPSGVVITGANNGACITVKFTSKYKGGFICVKANLPCGQSASACLNVILINQKPATPGSVSGPATLCPNETATYSVALVSGASGYTWNSSSSLSILSGQGTNSVTVKAAANFNGGFIKVKASNCSGSSGFRSKNVAKTAGCRIAANQSGITKTGLENNNDWIAYPNPTSGKTMLSFTTNQEDSYVFKVSDLIGKIVYMQKMNVVKGLNSIEFDLKNFNEGLYIISVQSEKELIKTIRVIKEE
jgi:hypothetical protein